MIGYTELSPDQIEQVVAKLSEKGLLKGEKRVKVKAHTTKKGLHVKEYYKIIESGDGEPDEQKPGDKETESNIDVPIPKQFIIAMNDIGSRLSKEFIETGEIELTNEIKNVLKAVDPEDRDSVRQAKTMMTEFYSSDPIMSKMDEECKVGWIMSSNGNWAAIMKDSMLRLTAGTELQHHDAIDKSDWNDHIRDMYKHYNTTREDVDKYMQLQKKQTRAILDVITDKDDITLYRGTSKYEIDGDIDEESKVPQGILLTQNPLSSWSMSEEIADHFSGGIILQSTISKDNIWSTYITHGADMNEQEVIVTGKVGAKAEIIKVE